MAVFSLLFGCLSALKSYTGEKKPLDCQVDSLGRSVRYRIFEHTLLLNCPSNRRSDGIYLPARGTQRTGGDIRLVVIASGFVLGEGVVSIVSLILRILGVGVISCFGCGHGLCGGCATASI